MSRILDFIATVGAKDSKAPTIIIPEFLYLGDVKTARWYPHLLSNKITHVINLAGCSNFWETEDEISEFWHQQSKEFEQSLEKDNDLSNGSNEIVNKVIVDNEIIPLTYLKVDILDAPSSNIYIHFHECIDFIENAKSTNGRVYVHCLAGISRSVSIVIAYLMNSQKIFYEQALGLIKEKRPNVKPNKGFVKQLQEFEKELFTILARDQHD